MIALFFGSFNPPHKGHLAVGRQIAARIAAANNGEERLKFIVSPHNPLKNPAVLEAQHHRLAMTRIMAQEIPGAAVSDVEFSLPKPNFTLKTLEHLSAAEQRQQFAIVMGEDNLRLFSQWRGYKKIAARWKIFVYPRHKADDLHPVRDQILAENRAAEIEIIEAPLVPISSTEIRQRIKENRSIREWVTEGVERYIQENRLYQ